MHFHYVQNVEEVLPLVLSDGRAPAAKKRSRGSRKS